MFPAQSASSSSHSQDSVVHQLVVYQSFVAQERRVKDWKRVMVLTLFTFLVICYMYIAITFITIWSKRLEYMYCFQLIRREYSQHSSIIKREVTYVVIHEVYFIGHTKILSLQLHQKQLGSRIYVKNNSDHGYLTSFE